MSDYSLANGTSPQHMEGIVKSLLSTKVSHSSFRNSTIASESESPALSAMASLMPREGVAFSAKRCSSSDMISTNGADDLAAKESGVKGDVKTSALVFSSPSIEAPLPTAREIVLDKELELARNDIRTLTTALSYVNERVSSLTDTVVSLALKIDSLSSWIDQEKESKGDAKAHDQMVEETALLLQLSSRNSISASASSSSIYAGSSAHSTPVATPVQSSHSQQFLPPTSTPIVSDRSTERPGAYATSEDVSDSYDDEDSPSDMKVRYSTGMITDETEKIMRKRRGEDAGTVKKRRCAIPNAAIGILKQWIAEHTDYPYPSDDEKSVLSNRTNLTLVQINNWFSNARRRYLKKLASSSSASVSTVKFVPK